MLVKKIEKIDTGKTSLNDLPQIFDCSKEDLDKKKARLFPSGNTKEEVATTSIFLSSLSAVKEYREELFLELGITKLKTRNASLHIYTELSKKNDRDRPDGLIVITSGKNNPIIEWACFVESKVKSNPLDKGQLERYMSSAKNFGINNIITISNDLVTTPKDSPIEIKKRNFNFYHWSWKYLKVTCSRLIKADMVKDKDHIYILKELRRYFESHKNLNNFVSMGNDWKDSTNKIHRAGMSKKIDKSAIKKVVDSYLQEEKDISLQLTDASDFHVELLVKQNRREELESTLLAGGDRKITTQYFLNRDKNYTFFVEIDFISQIVKCFTPRFKIEGGKAKAQTSKLLQIFTDVGAPDHILINAYYKYKKQAKSDVSLSTLFSEKYKGKAYSILDKGLGDEIAYFEVSTSYSLGKNFTQDQKFIVKLENITKLFLTQVMSNVKIYLV